MCSYFVQKYNIKMHIARIRSYSEVLRKPFQNVQRERKNLSNPFLYSAELLIRLAVSSAIIYVRFSARRIVNIYVLFSTWSGITIHGMYNNNAIGIGNISWYVVAQFHSEVKRERISVIVWSMWRINWAIAGENNVDNHE